MPAIAIDCPYCGERIDVVVDASAGGQRLIEDCQVCCQPIELHADVDDAGGISLRAQRGDDA